MTALVHQPWVPQACGIGLPIAPVDGDLNGLRFGTPEQARWLGTSECFLLSEGGS